MRETDYISMRHKKQTKNRVSCVSGVSGVSASFKKKPPPNLVLSGSAGGANPNCVVAGGSPGSHGSEGQGEGWVRRCVCPPPSPPSRDSGLTGSSSSTSGSETTEVQCFPEVWSELRHNEQLCDGVIHCADGKDLKVHRAILAAVSPYFKALFTNTINGGQPESSECSTEAVTEALRPILDYAYTGRCAVSSHNVQRLLPLADQLGVLGVVQRCCHFLLNAMRPDNCLGIFHFAQQYFCRDLEARGRRYMLHHFRAVLLEASDAELDALTGAELRRLLADDHLNASSEEQVFEAARRWVERDPEGRRGHLADLLPCVRLGRTSLRFLHDTVLKYQPVRDDQALQELLRQAESFLASNKDLDLELGNPLARPRIPYEILFAVGGWSAGSLTPTNFVETYDCRANRWCLSSNRDMLPRAYHGLVELDGLIYMIGGFDGAEHFNTVRSFEPARPEWKERACMYQARCYVSVCTLGGEIYALGGFDGRTRMSSAECYNPQKNQWRMIPPMNRARSDASAASLNGKVYVVGGFNGQEVLSSAEVFDPGTSQWTFVSCMHSARSGVSLVSHRGYLYALGGFNGYDRLSSGERFDPAASEWQPIRDMFYPRSNFAAAILDDLIYVIGGFNGSIIPNTERYDAETNEWKEAKQMNLNRSALSAVVLAGLPTAEEYSYLHVIQQDHCAEGK